MASTLGIDPGHNALLLAFRAERGDTVLDIESKVISWLSTVLDVGASGRTQEGEFALGPADPVTVVPAPTQSVRQREASFCRAARRTDVLDAPVVEPDEGKVVIPVVVHIDWAGAPIGFAAAWAETLFSWEPDESDPDLVVRSVCFSDERVRPPAEDPDFIDQIRDELATSDRAKLATRALIQKVGLTALGAGLFWWFSRRKQRRA